MSEATLQRLRRALDISGATLDFLQEPDAVKAYLDSLPITAGTKKNYYSHIIVAIRADERFKETVKTYRAWMKAEAEANCKTPQTLTESERSRWLEWEEILSVVESLRKKAKSWKLYRNFLTLMLTTAMPPQRLDYSPMRFASALPEDTTYNVCVLTDTEATFYFYHFKTAEWYRKTYGTVKTLVAPPALFSVLQFWRTLNPSGWLLPKSNKRDPMTSKGLGETITAIFQQETGKAVSVDILRHSYISYRRRGEMSKAEKEELARAMGHTTGMNEEYRRVE